MGPLNSSYESASERFPRMPESITPLQFLANGSGLPRGIQQNQMPAEIEPTIDPRIIAIEKAQRAQACVNTYGAHAAEQYLSGQTETNPDNDPLLLHFKNLCWEAERELDEFTVVDRY